MHKACWCRLGPGPDDGQATTWVVCFGGRVCDWRVCTGHYFEDHTVSAVLVAGQGCLGGGMALVMLVAGQGCLEGGMASVVLVAGCGCLEGDTASVVLVAGCGCLEGDTASVVLVAGRCCWWLPILILRLTISMSFMLAAGPVKVKMGNVVCGCQICWLAGTYNYQFFYANSELTWHLYKVHLLAYSWCSMNGLVMHV